MKKKIVSILTWLLAMTFIFAGCGAKESASYDAAAPYTEEAPVEEWIYDEEAVEEEAKAESPAAEASGTQQQESNRKLIKRYYIDLETRDYEQLVSYIQDAVAAAGGYIEHSSVSGTSIDGYGNRSAYYVLRVPVSGANNFMAGLEENGHMTHKSEEVEDVTLAYVDTESRIESLRVEQEVLMEMLESATDLDNIFAIQSRLTDIRYQLESHESQLRTYDNLVDYTTITVDVREVERETIVDDGTFGSRLKEKTSNNLHGFLEGAESIIIWFLAAFPYWILLAVVATVVVICVKASDKRYWKKKGLENVLKQQDLEANSKEKEE